MSKTGKQVKRNLVMNVFSFLAQFAVGFFLTPYLLLKLGKSAYGLIALAYIVTDYMFLISMSITSSVGRFLTIDLQKKDEESALVTMNTAFFATFFLIVIQIPILLLIVVFIDNVFKIPLELIREAKIYFILIFAGYLISLFRSILNVPLFANNRLDLIKTIDISRIITRVSVIVLSFVIFGENLVYVGAASLVGSIVVIVISFIYSKGYFRSMKFSITYFNKIRFFELVKMGGWLVVDQLGSLLIIKIDLIVINRFLGSERTGEYAALQRWNEMIRQIGATISVLTGPLIYRAYSEGDETKVIRYSLFSTKIMSIFMAMIIGTLAGLSKSFLSLWLGDEFAQFSWLFVLLISPLLINLSVAPLFNIFHAYNKVKFPGIANVIFGVLNLILAIVFCISFANGLIGVALASAIGFSLKNIVFTPYYVSRIIPFPIRSLFSVILVGVIYGIILFLLLYVLEMNVNLDTWLKLIIPPLIILPFSLFIILKFGLTSEDKTILTKMQPGIKKIL